MWKGSLLYSIAEMAGLGVSTICCIVSEVANAVVETLWESEVTTYMPKSEIEFYQKVSGMEQMWQFPCCWGAIHGCHVPVKCPPGWRSKILQSYNQLICGNRYKKRRIYQTILKFRWKRSSTAYSCTFCFPT